MKKLIISLVLIFNIDLSAQAWITHRNDIGGRLGDKFLTITKTLWLARKYNLHFQYNPSDYYKPFTIHTNEPEKCSYPVLDINNENRINRNASSIYRTDYYFKCNKWRDSADFFAWQDLVDDSEFRDALRRKFRVSSFTPSINLPSDRISVALHVRKGSGGDLTLHPNPKISREKIRNVVTVRMPRDQFYIEQIKKMSELYGNAPMYVYIFTDHADPQKIKERYSKKVNKPNIIFDCRKGKNSHLNDAAVTDLCEMLRFDCLIRSMSNLGQMAHALGRYQSVIYPLHATKTNGTNESSLT